MEASGGHYSDLRKGLAGQLDWLLAVAEREYELERLLDPSGDAGALDEFEVLVDVLRTAVVSAARAEAAISSLLGQVAAAQGDNEPAVRFEHPRSLREGWSVTPQSAEQDELIARLDRLHGIVKGDE